MLKFMKHQQKLTPERIQKQKELFSYSKACQHGFPTKPSSLAYDEELSLLALGTQTGAVTVYGAPGVEYYGQHESHDQTVTSLHFVPGKGQLITLCSDNTLHQWQIQPQSSQLKHLRSTTLEGKLKKISVISCAAGSNNLLVGTEGGNIYLCNLTSFTISDNIIYQDVVMQNVPEEFKVNPGAVECLCQHPLHPDRVLIGYQRGLTVLWDMPGLNAVQTYVAKNQQLESISWHSSGTKFMTCHNDGSVSIWPSELPSEKGEEEVDKQPAPVDGPNTIYGPFPCKPITGLSWKDCADRSQSLLVFGGGMQRASHGDRHTVTAMHYDGGSEADSSLDQHVTFNLSSRVIDFLVIEEKTADSDQGKYVGGCLVILCEEEIVFIDLLTPDWPVMSQPYLCSLHCSAITCTSFVSNPNPAVYHSIRKAGDKVIKKSGLSTRSLPINGGTDGGAQITPSRDTPQDLLVTAHEDGSVRVWAAGGVCVTLLHMIATAPLFVSDDPPLDDSAGAEDDDWPPFRKTGLFDPYSDDPRFAIKKVEMCGLTGMLVVAGTAGQIIVLQYSDEGGQPAKIQAVPVNLVAANENFVWKSHSKLELKQEEEVSVGDGVDIQMMIQLTPPAACTSLHLHSEWGLLACGTAHGFCLADVVAKKNLLAKSTLSALDMANAADEGPMSRRKSLKKSLRESFRRLRRGRSGRKTTQVAATKPQPRSAAAPPAADDVRPVERAIESRQQQSDYLGSMVRCLYLTKCFIANNQVMSATLWAGTNSGNIYVFTVAIPPSDKRKEAPITVQLGKEIRLKHAAPVLSITILDANSRPFPPPMAVKKELAAAPDNSGPHKVLICSEEQFKVFTLPQLKPFTKYKMTAIDGSRVRKIGFCDFVSSVDPSYKESCFTVVSNQGDASVYSLPDCRRQIDADCFKREDINGINSAVFSNKGELLFLTSPSEMMRVSLSAAKITQPKSAIKPVKAATPVKSPVVPSTTVPETSSPKKSEETPLKSKEEEVKVPAKSPQKETEEDATTTAISTLDTTTISTTSSRKIIEELNGGDTSLLSGDITIDSIRDHIVSGSNTTLASTTTIGSTCTTQQVSSSVTTKQITVVKTTTTSQEKNSEENGKETNVVVVESSTTSSSTNEAPTASSDAPPTPSVEAPSVNGSAE